MPSVRPYLFFGGRCEEALKFYREAVNAEVQMLIYHKDSPVPAAPGVLQAGFENKVMHATIRIGESTIQASDGCNEQTEFGGFSLSLSVANESEAESVFAALAEGGKIQMPLTKTFWSPRFGMLTDRFGVDWMVNANSPQA